MKYIKPLCIFLLLVGIFGFLLHSAYIEVKTQTIDQLNREQMILAKQAAKSIEGFFDHYMQSLNTLARIDHVVSPDEEGKNLMLIFYETHADEIKSLTRVNAEGKVIYAVPLIPNILTADLSRQEHIQEIMNTHQPVVSDVFTTAQGFESVALHVPVLKNNEYQGSLGILIPFDYLAKKYLEDIKIGKDGYAWMISQKGVELYCPVPEHIGKSVFENCKDFPTILVMAQEMIQGRQGVTSYIFNRVRGQTVESVRKLAVYFPVRLLNKFWSIVVATPEDEALKSIKGFRDRWFIIIGFLLLVVGAFSYYFGRALIVLKEEANRKQAEDAIRDSEERFRKAFDQAAVGIAHVHTDGRFIRVNQRFSDIVGFSIEELLTKTFADITHSDDLQLSHDKVQSMLEKPGQEIVFEKRYIKKDGSMVWGRVFSSAVRDKDGASHYFTTVLEDITDQKRIEQELVDSEFRFRELFNHMSSGAAIYESPDDGQSFVFKDLNEAGLEYGNMQKDEVIDREVRDVFPGVEALGLFEVFKRVWKTGISEHHPSSIYEDDKLELWVENYVCKLPSGELVAIYEDITARKKDEQAKEKLENQLRHAQKMEAVGTLAGGIAHEFNNILGIMLGNAELAADDIPEWNPAKHNLNEIKSASLRAKDVVRQLLTFSRKAEEYRRPLDLVPVIKEAIKFLRSSIPTSIEIRQNVADECHTVAADPTQIHQVMMNLSTNAVHAMEEKGGILEFSLQNFTVGETTEAYESKLRPGEYVMLKVSDTGSGIPAEVLDRIFDPYFTTKDVGKGTGMGLAVVHGIVETHGGAIRVESEEDLGTTFKIFLPVITDRISSVEETREDLPTGTERILFIDDEEPLARLGSLQLKKLGYRVHAETNPNKALDLFCSNPEQFDLVITDMTMPNMTGDQLITEILRIRPDTPIVLCTGFSERIDEDKARMLGARAYVLKPLDRKKLAITVRELLDKATLNNVDSAK